MGGTISADSEPGTGSSFRFEIPFARAEAEVRAHVPANELGGLRVLIVDDNPTNRRIFEAYVASWGMRPDIARDAESALAQLEQAAQSADPYDIALLDQHMPGEDGLELARRITASPKLRRARLILLTSSGQITTDDPTTGITCHLTKPVRQSRLLDAISAAMALDDDAGHPAPHRSRGPSRPAPAHAGSRILVAEDQHVNWTLIERTLTKRGHVAVNATDGREALEMLETERYDLILMDCQMPLLDGYDTAREIRHREVTGQRGRVPIIAMTANAMLGDREKCLAAGMDDYITKPVSTDLLDEKLARWLHPASADAHVLDQDRLLTLRTLFPGEEMSGMLAELTASITTELDHIDHALAAADNPALLAAAHRLKNAAGMIGATELFTAAAQLEGQASTDHPDGDAPGDTTVRTLSEHWTATRVAIERELAQSGASSPAGR